MASVRVRKLAVTRGLALGGTLLLGACASTAVIPTATDGLSPRNVTPETCALYVWTADAARTFTYFASADETVLWVGWGELDVERDAAPLSPEQTITFSQDDVDYALDLELTSPDSYAGGTRYNAGALRSIEDGFERIVPVVGLATCTDS